MYSLENRMKQAAKRPTLSRTIGCFYCDLECSFPVVVSVFASSFGGQRGTIFTCYCSVTNLKFVFGLLLASSFKFWRAARYNGQTRPIVRSSWWMYM